MISLGRQGSASALTEWLPVKGVSVSLLWSRAGGGNCGIPFSLIRSATVWALKREKLSHARWFPLCDLHAWSSSNIPHRQTAVPSCFILLPFLYPHGNPETTPAASQQNTRQHLFTEKKIETKTKSNLFVFQRVLARSLNSSSWRTLMGSERRGKTLTLPCVNPDWEPELQWATLPEYQVFIMKSFV